MDGKDGTGAVDLTYTYHRTAPSVIINRERERKTKQII